MPYYSPLKKWNYKDRRRTIKGIQALRKQKQARIPTRTLEDTLLLATWNIRDFGNEDKAELVGELARTLAAKERPEKERPEGEEREEREREERARAKAEEEERKARDAAEHFCPWYSKAPRTSAVTSDGTSAEGWVKTKSLPPVSPTIRG